MRFLLAFFLTGTCVLSVSGLVIKPKATGPSCGSPHQQVTVPAGGSTTVSWGGARADLVIKPRASICGWIFTSEDGSPLTVDCESFTLKGNDQLLITEKPSNTRYKYSGRSGPSNLALDASKAVLAVRYDDASGNLQCTVSSKSTSSSSSSSGSTDCRCGIVNRQSSRIVGGVATEVNEYPWQAGLVWPNTRSVFCGGTLISDRYILTAAHCTDGSNPADLDIMLGAHSTNRDASSAIIVDPIRIINHADYGNPSMDNDIALIEIKPLDFSDPDVQVRPACLPDTDVQYVGSQGTVSGWGTLTEDGSQPSALREVTVPVVSNSECKSVYGSVITSNMLCAGTDAGGKDSCQGDSGGPLVTPDGENYELIGVVSFGAGCGQAATPGVYARVTEYLDWIEKNTPGSTTCAR
ncbi:Serine proteases trypsin domain [Trinorchestia longiramus]|nr:Serine proteases trypsin domain [Trinorchestia longiramus]